MGKFRIYFLSVLCVLLLGSCYRLSNETYTHLSVDEKRSLSAEYTQLAQRLEMGSPDNMELLEKAVRINPSNDLAWRELSRPYLYAGLYNEWNEYIEKAIELNPVAWQAWRGYDRLFYFRDYAGALFDLDATDTLTWDQVDYPQNISVDYLRGLCYMGLKDYDRAIEYFEKFAEDEAIKVGEEYIDEAVFLYLGKIYFERLEMSKSEHYLRRGLKFEDSFADFNYYLAQIYCYKNDLSQARVELNTAIKKFEDGNRLRGYRFEAIGQLYKSDLDELSILLGES